MDRARALGLTAVAAVLWGTSFPANDLGLAHTDAWTFLPLRFGIATAAGLAAARLLGGFDARWLRNPWVWAVALANTASFTVQFLAQELTGPGSTSLMLNAGNLTVPVLAFLVLRERVTGGKAPAIALAALGVVLVGTRGDLATVGEAGFTGNVVALAAGVLFALVIVLSKAALRGEGAALSFVVSVTGLTALMGLPGALLLGSGAAPPGALLAAAYTGTACTILAWGLWSAALRHLSSVASGLVLLLEIVVAMALSVALALEVLTLPTALGAACILVATALTAQAEAREASQAAAAAAAPAGAAPNPGSQSPP